MSTIRLTKHVLAPLDRTFELFTDFRQLQGRLSAVTKLRVLTEGPTAVGTRFQETRIIFKKEALEEMEVTAFEPNATISIACSTCGRDFITRYDFHPEDEGTRVELKMTSKAVTLMAKLTSPLAYLTCRPLMRFLETDMDELKALAETQANEA